jgi:lauroyl/myristoyl acyltransferase
VTLIPPANMARLLWNIFLNILVLPFLFLSYCLAAILALTQLFPARVARGNIRQHWNENAFTIWFGTSAVFLHYILLVIEDFFFWPLGGVVMRDNPDSGVELQTASVKAKADAKGVAVLSAHFGNIEITAQAICAHIQQQISNELPLMALAKPSRFPMATKLLSWYRAKRKIEVILTNRKDLVRVVLSAWKQQRAIAMLIDQKPAHGGLFTPFFGTTASFPEGGVEMALRTNCEFVCVVSRRIWPGFYTFEGCWLKDVHNSEQPSVSVVQGYAKWLESVIRISPWQWCWDYKKWSRKPAVS